MDGRILVILAGFLIALAGSVWRHSENCPATARPSTTGPPAPFAEAVTVRSETATIEWNPTAEHDDVLIVSSLGDPQKSFRVRLESRAASRESLSPVTPIARQILARPHIARAQSGGASPPPVEKARLGAPQEHREFSIHVADTELEDPRGYTSVRARRICGSAAVSVYLDEQLPADRRITALAEECARLLEEDVFPRSHELLGMHRDVDGDGTLAVLLTPWLARLRGGQTSVNGFVRSLDFDVAAAPPFSNRADVLFLNADLIPGPELRTLLTHEYTHAVCFSLRLPTNGRTESLLSEEDWLNEGIAHVAEQLHGTGWSNLDRRIATFLFDPSQSPLVIGDYYRAGLWRDPGCRGATYLFLQWCAEQHGPDLLRRLASSPLRGIANLEQAAGTPFADLFRRWTIALLDADYRALDLHDRIGDCALSGVSLMLWNSGDAPKEITLRGTSTVFVELPDAPASEKQVLYVEAEPGCRLQVTRVSRLGGRKERQTAAK